MAHKSTTPVSNARLRRLTSEVKRHASGARSEEPHSIRVKHAIACGKALRELKELLGHGQWIGWIQERCELSRMTANRYMRLSGRSDQIKPDMTIREAYIATGVITPK